MRAPNDCAHIFSDGDGSGAGGGSGGAVSVAHFVLNQLTSLVTCVNILCFRFVPFGMRIQLCPTKCASPSHGLCARVWPQSFETAN